MTLETTTHRTMLIKILKELYTDATIGPFLGFKGGTAAYLFYNLSRFSVDLDFDVLDNTREEYLFHAVHAILKKYGEVKEARQKRYSIFFLLSYEHKKQNAYNIKVELNRRDFGSHYEVKAYLGISMKVMVQQDMFAHKLVAMVERMGKSNRDIFDVWFFLSNHWPLNDEIIKKRTNMDLNQFLSACISALENLSNKNILSGIGELLDAHQKMWVKLHLKEETIFLLKLLNHS